MKNLFKKNRRGISNVVATVLLILLTVAAVAALISFLRPFVHDNLQKSTECIPYQGYYTFQENFVNESGTYNFNCYMPSGSNNLIGATISSGTNLTQDQMENLAGFSLVFRNDNGQSSTINVANGKSSNNSLGGIWRIDSPGATTLSINGPGDTLTYVYNTSNFYTDAGLYVVLKSGRVCDSPDTIKLQQCGTGVVLG